MSLEKRQFFGLNKAYSSDKNNEFETNVSLSDTICAF